MSEALVKTDKGFVDLFKKSGRNVCPHGYIRGAQDLAAALAGPHGWGRRDLGWSSQPNGTPPTTAHGVKGLVCYMNIPTYHGQGHIDLWDGKGPVGDEYWDAETIWLWKLQ
jgi:hypothetical protein